MRLAICGSIFFKDYLLFKKEIKTMLGDTGSLKLMIYSGKDHGTDRLCRRYCEEHGTPSLVFIPEYVKYGKTAYRQNNKKILDNCDYVLAFQDGSQNNPLKNMLNQAKLENKYVRKVFI